MIIIFYDFLLKNGSEKFHLKKSTLSQSKYFTKS